MLASRNTQTGEELPFDTRIGWDPVAADAVVDACVCEVGVAHFEDEDENVYQWNAARAVELDMAF
jgi:hypothetical protein